MYWAYLVLFILAIFVPDIVRGDLFNIPEEKVEELLIFFFGVIGFLIFIFKEHQLSIKESEEEKIVRKLSTTTKELEKSYTYIGEVNRKLEMLMHIGLGLINYNKNETKAKEREAYDAILTSAASLLKGASATLRFVNVKNNKTQKEVSFANGCNLIKNTEFLSMGENVNIKKGNGYIIASSFKDIRGTRCYLIVDCYEDIEDSDEGNHNHEILKFLASHALFLYA